MWTRARFGQPGASTTVRIIPARPVLKRYVPFQLLCISVSLAGQQLDVEYTLGVATNAEVYFLTVGNTAQDGMFGFLDTANAVLDSWSDAYVITTSYGQDEHYFTKDVVE